MMDNLDMLMEADKHKEYNMISQALETNKTEYKAELEYLQAV